MPDEAIPTREGFSAQPESKQGNERTAPGLSTGSAMHGQYGPILRGMFARYFSTIRFPEEMAQRLRGLAENHTLVYLGGSASLLHFLVLNHLCLRLGLPLARFVSGIDPVLFQPVSRLWQRLRVFDENNTPSDTPDTQSVSRELHDRLLVGQSALLFLGQPNSLTSDPKSSQVTRLFQALIETQTTSTRPIVLVPHLLMFNQQPERAERNVADTLFGQHEAPGLVRSWFMLFRRYRKAYVQISEPLLVGKFLQQTQADAPLGPTALAQALQHFAQRILTEERVALTGPLLKPPAEFKRQILADAKIQTAIQSEAGDDPVRQESLRKRSHDILDEIAAEPRFRWTSFFDRTLDFLWRRIYAGIVDDADGFQKIRDAIRKSPIVFCPSHKSHIDYLVMSQRCLANQLPTPHVAAGINLNFWPLGSLFRYAGAFFMRRSFKGDPLYPVIFRTYLRHVMKEGFPIEFFIEGTRSRTGKLLNPRFGILSWLVDAALEEGTDDLQFIPISIDYEKIVESRSYVNELSGGEKEKENMGALLKSGNVLRSKYGKVYVQIGEPLSLREALKESGGENPAALEPQRKLVGELAHEILYRINRVATVTPSAVLAFCLLNHRRRGMTQEILWERAEWTLGWIRRRPGPRFSQTFDDPKRALAEAARRFSEAGLLQIQDTGQELVYLPIENQRLGLDYYRNNLIQHFVPAGLLALALGSFTVEAVPLATLEERVLELTRLFRYEFLFRSEKHFRDDLAHTLASLREEGVVREENGFVVKVHEASAAERLSYLRASLEHFVEAYWLAARGLEPLLKHPMSDKDLLASMLVLGDGLYVQGEIQFAESISREICKNALEWFVQREVLRLASTEGRKGTHYTLITPWDQADHLPSLAQEIGRYRSRSA